MSQTYKQILNESLMQKSHGNHQEAWSMVNDFIKQCESQYKEDITAILLTGSLANGSYQPGLSDVDVITILKDETPENTRSGISEIYNQVHEKHGIQFEPVILRHRDFWPPWNDDLCIQPEIHRLKASGKVLYGEENIIEQLPIPTKKEMWEFDISFREWLLKSDEQTWHEWSLKGALKVILGEASTYFYYKTGIVEHSKHHIAEYMAHQFPHFSYLSAVKFAAYLWQNYPDNADEGLRFQMAKQARDTHNHVTMALGFGERYIMK